MLFFSWDVLLAVAVELFFRGRRAWPPGGTRRLAHRRRAPDLEALLGALLCAVLLGATIDHFLPQVDSLPEAVRMLQRG